jgi:hypothetical protein
VKLVQKANGHTSGGTSGNAEMLDRGYLLAIAAASTGGDHSRIRGPLQCHYGDRFVSALLMRAVGGEAVVKSKSGLALTTRKTSVSSRRRPRKRERSLYLCLRALDGKASRGVQLSGSLRFGTPQGIHSRPLPSAAALPWQSTTHNPYGLRRHSHGCSLHP